jgi:hypothetical protein
VLPDEAVIDGRRWLLKLHGTVRDPDSIVLTREDYLSYNRRRAALSSLAKTMLITRHLLFVGFGFKDDHFHEIMHEVREAFPHDRHASWRFGTALMLGENPLEDQLWGKDLEIVRMPGENTTHQGRTLEILLDRVLAESVTGTAFLFDPRYGQVLGEVEDRLRNRLSEFVEETSSEERQTKAWRQVHDVLSALGLDR